MRNHSGTQAYARHAVTGFLEFTAYFQELNRRMHNKLFIVDNRMAIVGGRNIGNAYFGLSEKYNFRDLDVLTTGPVVEEISEAFDDYWNAKLAYPGYLMSNKVSTDDVELLRQGVKKILEEDRDLLASYSLAPRDWSKEMKQLTHRMHSGEGHFLQDDPIVVHGEEIKLIDMLDRNLKFSTKVFSVHIGLRLFFLAQCIFYERINFELKSCIERLKKGKTKGIFS